MRKMRGVVVIVGVLLILSAACTSAQQPTATPIPEMPASATVVVPTYTPAQSEPAKEVPTTWYVVGDEINVHSCPSTDCEILATFAFGRRLVVLETTDGWHKIRLAAGEHGWIQAHLTSQSAVCKSCQ